MRGRSPSPGPRFGITRPQDAQALGITTVFQDLALCDNLDVVANLHLGTETRTLSALAAEGPR